MSSLRSFAVAGAEVRAEGAARALAVQLGRTASGLLKAYVITAGPDRVAFVGLWSSASDAAAATSCEQLATLAEGLDVAAPPEVMIFDTPVLIDAELRGRAR